MVNPGDKIQHYEIVRLLGRGGMGEVYLARDSYLDRNVALKFLPDELEADPRMRERFLREAKSAAALDHPFICKIYETGVHQGKNFIAMEYVEGQNLKDRMEQGPMPLRDAIRITVEVGEALENAHRAGIVHRDLKPANIMISPQGHIKVMDFGLAKHILPQGDLGGMTKTMTPQSITEHGAIAGTIAYMSPEQAKGGTIDARSDIFSLGIILYEMIADKNPFSKPSPIETLTSILRDAVPATHVTPKSVNPVLNPILNKVLAKGPGQRYQKIEEFITDLKKFQKETAGETRILFRGWPAVAVLIVAMLITGVFLITRRSSVNPPASGPKTISVLVANFQNKTGDPIFDGVLEKTLDISLAGTSFISLYNRQEALKVAAKLDPSAGETLNEKLAQLVSRKAGINVVVGGSVEKSDKGYTIKVWALDTVKTKNIYEGSTSIGTPSEILRAADRFSAKLRSNLGGVSADSVQALTKETFTTTSLDAMQAFARGQELDDVGKSEEALKEYLRAIDHDPNFGRAYASLAVIYLNEGRLEDAEKYFQEAMKRLDQMTDREKYRTRGIYYLMVRDWKKAIDEYGALLKQYPGDYVIHAMLAIAYFFARDMPKAVEEGRLDVKYNPQGVHAHNNLSWYSLAVGDLKTAEEESRTALKIQLDFPRAYLTLALTQLAKDQPAQTEETYQKLKALGTYGATLSATGLADLAVYEGRLGDAVKILEEGIPFDLKNNQAYDAAIKCIMLAQTYLLQEKKERAIEAADRAVKISSEVEIQFSADLVYLDAGQEDKARSLHTELNKKLQPEPRAYARLIGGELSRARGDIGNAVKLFHEAKSEIDTWLSHFFLGRAYLQAEDYTAAMSEFETCLKRRGEAASVFLNDLPSFRYLPPLYFYLGRTQEGFSNKNASDSYNQFLKIKEKDDGSDPLVKEARRRLAALH